MSEPQNIQINISTMAIIKIALAVLLLLAVWAVRDIILLVVVAMVLASALDPLVEWLYRKARFPRGLSVLLVYLFFIGLVAGVVYFLTPPIVSEFGQLGDRLGEFKSDLASRAGAITQILNQFGLQQSLAALARSASDFTVDFFQKTAGVLGGLAHVIAVLAITFYLISSENGMKNFIKSIVPYRHQAYAAGLTEKIQKKIGYWLLGQLVLSVFIFIFDFLGLQILGVKFALALALFAGLIEIVPYLGPILAAIPGIIVAFTQSPTLALFAALMYFAVQQLENYLLVPKVMGRSVGANPLVILLAVLAGFKLAGIVGMLLAVPIVAAASVFITDFRDRKS